jgi:ribonuclease VapC
MAVDTSALVPIALGEPSRPRLLDALETARVRALSAVSLLEAGMVLRACLGPAASALLYQLVSDLVTEVVPFDEPQATRAVEAFGRFGKGTSHPAQLNFGECAVYALAASRSDSVPATGDDFAATDLRVHKP